MIEFGQTLLAARESKGYTVSQLAELTHLAPSVIECLEAEDFSHIPAPIYGRGFVKLYCERVGLEPKPLIDAFMAIINGAHEPRIRERARAPLPPEPERAPLPSEPERQPEAAEPGSSGDFVLEGEAVASPPVAPPPADEPAPAPAPADDGPTVSRYAAPFHERHAPQAPTFQWRLAALIAAAGAAIVLVFLGIRALYRLTMPSPAPEDEPPLCAESASAPAPAPASEPARTPRTPQKIPPLYID